MYFSFFCCCYHSWKNKTLYQTNITVLLFCSFHVLYCISHSLYCFSNSSSSLFTWSKRVSAVANQNITIFYSSISHSLLTCHYTTATDKVHNQRPTAILFSAIIVYYYRKKINTFHSYQNQKWQKFSCSA